jgi:hypothetical protein
MSVAASEVLLPEADDRLGSQVVHAREAIGIEQLAGPGTQSAVKPLHNESKETIPGVFD